MLSKMRSNFQKLHLYRAPSLWASVYLTFFFCFNHMIDEWASKEKKKNKTKRNNERWKETNDQQTFCFFRRIFSHNHLSGQANLPPQTNVLFSASFRQTQKCERDNKTKQQSKELFNLMKTGKKGRI